MAKRSPIRTGAPLCSLTAPILDRARNLFRGDLQAIVEMPAQHRWEWFMAIANASKIPEVDQTMKTMLSEVFADIEAWLAMERMWQAGKSSMRD